MPQPANVMVPPGEIIETRVFDEEGQPIAVIPYQRLYRMTQHGMVEIKQADNVLLADGVVWNPSLAARQGEALLLAVCYFCRFPHVGLLFKRERPSNGLMTLQNARACRSCGRTCCPRHISHSRHGRNLCHHCARRNWLWQFIKPLFFRRVEE